MLQLFTFFLLVINQMVFLHLRSSIFILLGAKELQSLQMILSSLDSFRSFLFYTDKIDHISPQSSQEHSQARIGLQFGRLLSTSGSSLFLGYRPPGLLLISWWSFTLWPWNSADDLVQVSFYRGHCFKRIQEISVCFPEYLDFRLLYNFKIK